VSVVFLDIDGTLCDFELRVPSSAAGAVRAARRNGHQVVLTTGRSRAEVYPQLWELGVDGLIGGNGMYIEHHGDVLADRVMPRDAVDETVAWMQARGIGFYLESRNGLFASDRLVERATFIFGEDTLEHRQKFMSFLPDLIYGGELSRDDVAKISFVLNPDHLDDARRAFGDRLAVSTWSGSGQRQEFGEFALPGVNKVHAIQALLATLPGVERTFAFGDAESDRAMIEFCDVGVAMGNAPDDLKAVADHVAQAVDQDGLALAFRDLGLT
jgi:Cof subfamily protein (haloacid dehalogenase superfamily)